MFAPPLRRTALNYFSKSARRTLGTLSNNPHIVSSLDMCEASSKLTSTKYTFPHIGNSSYLSLLPTTPPTPELAIGITKALPPTPNSFAENPNFLNILQEVLKEYAAQDPGVQAQAQAFASNAGASFGAGGALFAGQRKRRGDAGFQAGGDRAGATTGHGAGGAGRGGWVHLSDLRSPPDFGRIACPEDIFGSLEVDANGLILDGGNYQPSGTYRIVTREGM